VGWRRRISQCQLLAGKLTNSGSSNTSESDPERTPCHGAKAGICIKIEPCRDPPEGTKMRRRGGRELPVKGRHANGPKARTSAPPSIADLEEQVAILPAS
jgi:hypothetical protein